MKKLLAILLALTLALTLVPTTALACQFCDYTRENGYHYAWEGKTETTHNVMCPSCGYTWTENHLLDHTNRYAATCTEDGREYDLCYCGYTIATRTIPALGHDLEHHDAKSPTCTEKGWDAYETCKREGCNYTTYKEIDVLGHDWGEWTSNGNDTHSHRCQNAGCTASETNNCSGGTATCKDKAVCEVCGVEYGALDSNNHANLKHVEAKRATTRAEGNIEYWYCDSCGKYYKDEAAETEITQADTVIAKKRRTSSSDSTDDKTIESPKTGDPGVMLYVGLAAMSLTGGAWLRRKKH